MGPKKQWNNNNIPEASKPCFQENKHHDRISCVYKEWKILKFLDILNLQNCLFMYQISIAPNSVPLFLLFRVKTSTTTTLGQQHNLLDIPLTETNMYGKNSIKNLCIRDWNNLKRDFSDIPDSELSLSKIKSYLKQKYYGQYWTLSSLSSKYHTPQSILAII